MSDLIKRSDAIKALGEEPEVWNDTKEEWAYRDAWVEHIAAIKALPSAEFNIVRCKDCKYWVPDEVGVVEQPLCTRLGYEKDMGFDLRIGSADDYCSFGERRESDTE